MASVRCARMGLVGRALRRGRAFARQAWAEAVDLLAASGRRTVTTSSAWRWPRTSSAGTTRASGLEAGAHRSAATGTRPAARCAFWLCMLSPARRDGAGQWVAGAGRTALGQAGESAAAGFLLVPPFLEAIEGGDVTAAAGALADKMVGIAQRFDDADVFALAMLCAAEAASGRRDARAGCKLLDEAMLSVTAGGRVADPSGHRLLRGDRRLRGPATCGGRPSGPRRSRRWCAASPTSSRTAASAWSTGRRCSRRTGSGPKAVSEAERAVQRLADTRPPRARPRALPAGRAAPAARRARRRRAGLPRGQPARARAAPGFALLRLAEGDVAAPSPPLRRMLDEHGARPPRAGLLAAAVEVLLAAGDVDGAPACPPTSSRRSRPPIGRRRCCRPTADYARGHRAAGRGRRARGPRRAPPGRCRLARPADAVRRRPGPVSSSRSPAGRSATTTPPTLELDGARADVRAARRRRDLARVAAARRQPAARRPA